MKRKLLFATFLLVFFNSIFAQQFPVSIIPRVKAPAPVNFYNYADDASLNSPLTVQIFLNDLTIPSRQIRLKTYFEGGNIRFSSKDFVVGAQDLFLEGGIPLTLRNTELAPYYRLENIQGISSSVYGQTIPEGSYNFCFEVYDYISGAKLSAKKCATVFIFKNEPPILNIPLTGSNIEPSDFENIIFQWTPRQINVSNVEYEFSIVEVWDNSVNPQTAFLSQIPIYEETTRRTTLIYGPDKPLLLPGRKYAWRVRAKALQGLEEIGLFKNQGYSEVFWFSRTAPCQVPQGISAEAKGTSKINVFWEQDPTVYSEYIIAYRENGKANANWFTKRTNSSWATIWNLKPGTTYEYKIKGKCSYQFSDYSELQYVTTDLIQNEDANYNCGIVPDEIAISNRNPHAGLTIGDEITAGDFKVIITEIQSQSNGRISGKGYVAIPYLKFARFGVTFSNILINTANQLAEGEIVTLYDPEFGKGASADVDVDVDISDGINGDDGIKDDLVEVDFVIDEVKIDANGAIVVTGTNGEEAIIPGDDDISIKSANGDVWSVGEDGTITKEEGAEGGAVAENTTNGIDNEGNVNSITATGVTVVFQESGDYYFDALPENTSTTFEKEYKILEANGTKYKVPYKAVSDIQGEDFITAKVAINDASISKEDIIFKTKDGAKVEANWNNNSTEVTLKLKRKFDYADEEIFAVVKSKEDNEKYDIAGSLITTHLASKELEAINVTLIPVGDGVVISDDLKEKTAEIYNKAGVRLNIQTGQSILPDEVYGWDKDGNKRLKVGDSSILSHYTDEQLMFNNYVKQQEYYTDKTYYVFVTNISITNANVSGFMPLKRQFGFVFTQNATTVTKQSRTLAHELGHGIFGLEHTWDEYQFGQGATNFLMDYGSGTVLNHLDWKKMHAPGVQLYWFQGDEDGEYIHTGIDYNALVSWLKANKGKKEVEYNPNLFLTDSTISVLGDKIPISVQFQIGNRKLKLWGSLSSEKGIVDVSNIERHLDLEINEKHIYTDKINYINGETHSRKDAIRLTIRDVKDYVEYSEYVGIGLNKNYILEKFNKEFEKAGEDCNKLDFLYEHAPNFVIDERKTEHWSDLISLASCSINEGGSDEEKAVIKLIDAIGRDNSQKLLDGLLTHKVDDKKLFKVFYEKIDNFGGEDNFTKFIQIVYKNWLQSNYANLETELFIPYNSQKTLGFYTDDFGVFFKINKDEIFITSKYNSVDYNVVGSFGFYSKLNILNTGQTVEGLKIPSEEIPAFYLKAIKEVNQTANLETAFNLTFDAVTTVSGVGNLVKLRHLRHLSKGAKAVKYTVAGAEISAGVLNAMLTLSDCKTEFCNKLRTHLFWLEMGSLGLDVFTEQMIKKTAKEAYEKADETIDVNVREELARVAGVQVGIADKVKQLFRGNINLTGDKIGAVKGYINTNDNYIDIIVHSDNTGDNFSVIIELGGKTENITLTAAEFGQALTSIPSNKTIRLLSCNNSSSASEIAKVLDRDIIGSTGEMKIYSNNVIEADNWYVARANGKVEGIDMSSATPSGDFIILKQKFVDNLSPEVIASLKKILGNQYDEFIDMLTRSKLPGTWTIKNVEGKPTVVDRNGTVWGEISEGIIKAKIGGTGNGWNHLLNVDPPLMKNFRYEVDGGKFVFETDQFGRVSKAIMDPVEINKNIKRSEEFQARAKEIKDGSTVNVDDGGHIFRNEWGGPSEQINYFSQNANENRTGAWYNMEKEISKMLKSETPPNVKIEMEFNFTGGSKRPDSIDVIVKVDGKIDTQLSRSYDNPL